MLSPSAYSPVGKPSAKSGITRSVGFNRRADLIISGNAITNVQLSNYIRPRNETECNGFKFAHGALQKVDLDTLFRQNNLLRAARRYIDTPFFETNAAIAYVFFHYVGDKRHIHGVLITDKNYQLLRRFDCRDLGMHHRPNSENVMDFCQKFVTVTQQKVA